MLLVSLLAHVKTVHRPSVDTRVRVLIILLYIASFAKKVLAHQPSILYIGINERKYAISVTRSVARPDA